MLTIILGIVIAFAIFFLLNFLLGLVNGDGSFINALICVCIIIGAIALGLFAPISGYNDWELVEETKLVSLSNTTASGGTGFIYVSLSANNVYTYRYEVDSNFGSESSKEYETNTLTENVIESEDSNCKIPVLRKYKRTAKKSIWTFGVAFEEKYVFYVPEGSISKEINLQ
jgi:hypothetical protein